MTTPVGGPQAWLGAEVGHRDDWVHPFDGPGADEALTATARLADDVRSERTSLADIRLDHLTLPSLPSLAAMAATVRSELATGPGFALIRGLPVGELDDIECQVLYWLIGVHLGIPIHQDPAGSLLIRVRDQGRRWGDDGVRSYETAARLEYHSDSSDIVGLFCLRPALEGGTSTVVSSVAIHDAIVRRRPDLAPLLYETWPHLSAIDSSVSHKPISARNGHGRLFSRYGRSYVERAAARDDVADLTSSQVELLDLYDDLTNSPEFVLNMNFQAGDIQFLNNYVTMHSRTEYVDGDDPALRRELLRLWLVFRDDIDVPEVFEDSGFVPRTVAFQQDSRRQRSSSPSG